MMCVRFLVFTIVVGFAVTGLHAEEVPITCSVSSSTTYPPITELSKNKPELWVKENNPPGPWNFVITDGGLRTPWNDVCALMQGTVSADIVEVSCAGDLHGRFTRNVKIDRTLGTYSLSSIIESPLGEYKTFDDGTCEARKGF